MLLVLLSSNRNSPQLFSIVRKARSTHPCRGNWAIMNISFLVCAGVMVELTLLLGALGLRSLQMQSGATLIHYGE